MVAVAAAPEVLLAVSLPLPVASQLLLVVSLSPAPPKFVVGYQIINGDSVGAPR